MGVVRGNPEAMRAWAAQARGAATGVVEGRAALLKSILGVGILWSDEQYARVLDAYHTSSAALVQAGTTLAELADHVERLSLRLDAYLGEHTGLARGASFAAGATTSAAILSRAGDRLEQIPYELLKDADIDWNDLDFRSTFTTAEHHGYTAASYRALAHELSAVMQRLGSEPRHLDERERRVRDAFLGSNPIRVERDRSTGRLTVVEGRHRLFACLEAGISPPMQVVDVRK